MEEQDRRWYRELGNAIRDARKKRGYTASHAAGMIGVSQRAYVSYESGSRRIDARTLLFIVEMLQLDTHVLAKKALRWEARTRQRKTHSDTRQITIFDER